MLYCVCSTTHAALVLLLHSRQVLGARTTNQHMASIHVLLMQSQKDVSYRQFPRVGAYWACALKGSGERVEAILAVDSLMPPGNGRPLSDLDR